MGLAVVPCSRCGFVGPEHGHSQTLREIAPERWVCGSGRHRVHRVFLRALRCAPIEPTVDDLAVSLTITHEWKAVGS